MNAKFSAKCVALVAAGAMSMSLAACSGGSMDDSSSSNGSAANSDTITLGSVTTNSGTAAAYGEAEVAGFKLAVDEINAKGGINGKKVKLESMDDKGDATEASNAFNKLAGDNSVLGVVGPTISSTTAAVAPLADQSKLPAIAPAATSDSIETGGYMFRTCFKDSYQGEIAAKFAAETLKVKKVAVLYGTGDPYSSGVGKAFAAAAKKAGLDVVAEENSSSADDTEYSSQLQKIQAAGAEFLYAPYYYSVAGPYIIPQARSVGYKGYVMGPDGYDGLKMTDDKSLHHPLLSGRHLQRQGAGLHQVLQEGQQERRSEHLHRTGLRLRVHDEAGHRESRQERHPRRRAQRHRRHELRRRDRQLHARQEGLPEEVRRRA